MQNKQSPLVQATAIVDCIVIGNIRDSFTNEDQHNQPGLPISMKNIHLYLYSHLDILSKKFIFFPMNENQKHWNGWAAVNPWVQLA